MLQGLKIPDFGKIHLSEMEEAFYQRFNREMVSLCRCMPESVQSDSIVFLTCYSGTRPGQKIDFFANYYPPTWSIIFWLSNGTFFDSKPSSEAYILNAVKAQSMAMFIHSLDDHLTDQQIAVSLLTLLLRTEAWAIMNRSFSFLCDSDSVANKIVGNFINDYYSSGLNMKAPESLDSYCEQFRKQMAILLIAPVLLSLKISGISDLTKDVEVAFGSFGVAWRLLDDIRDIEEDIERGSETSVSLLLPEKMRTCWKHFSSGRENTADEVKEDILEYLTDNNVIRDIKLRICDELNLAATIAKNHDLMGLSIQFNSLSLPIIGSLNY